MNWTFYQSCHLGCHAKHCIRGLCVLIGHLVLCVSRQGAKWCIKQVLLYHPTDVLISRGNHASSYGFSYTIESFQTLGNSRINYLLVRVLYGSREIILRSDFYHWQNKQYEVTTFRAKWRVHPRGSMTIKLLYFSGMFSECHTTHNGLEIRFACVLGTSFQHRNVAVKRPAVKLSLRCLFRNFLWKHFFAWRYGRIRSQVVWILM